MKTKEEKFHSLVTSVRCLAYCLEDLNNLHLSNSMCIILDELAEITEDELPFDIPESWKWVRAFYNRCRTRCNRPLLPNLIQKRFQLFLLQLFHRTSF